MEIRVGLRVSFFRRICIYSLEHYRGQNGDWLLLRELIEC